MRGGHLRSPGGSAPGAGFTLIELLVVVTIIAALVGLVMAGSTWASRIAKIKATESILVRVNAAIGQFADRYGAIPTATWGEDPLVVEPADQWSNRLFWRLGSVMTKADRDAIEALVPAAVAIAEAAVAVADADAFKGGFAEVPPWRNWVGQYQNHVHKLLKSVRGEAAATRVRRAGTIGDFIGIEDIGERFLRSDGGAGTPVIVDAWGSPLIYVSRYEPGVTYRAITSLPGVIYQYNTDLVGLPERGRKTLVDANANGSVEDEAAVSDIRETAYPGFENRYELWSAGPDKRFNAIRGETVNRDNVTITVYKERP